MCVPGSGGQSKLSAEATRIIDEQMEEDEKITVEELRKLLCICAGMQAVSNSFLCPYLHPYMFGRILVRVANMVIIGRNTVRV